jgi:hypothetical protein
MSDINSYELSRSFFNWCFENPEKITPTHIAMYFFIIEHCNRLGWKDKFGLPTTMVKDAIGIRNFRTYTNALNDLVEWGFVIMIEKSKNQYSSNIIAIAKNTKAHAKALDKALQKHVQKQSKSIDSILKQETNKQETIQTIKTCFSFDDFWAMYDKKIDSKKCMAKYEKLTEIQRAKIKQTLPAYLSTINDKQFQKHPATYLNNECWNDDIFSITPQQQPKKPPLDYR